MLIAVKTDLPQSQTLKQPAIPVSDVPVTGAKPGQTQYKTYRIEQKSNKERYPRGHGEVYMFTSLYTFLNFAHS